MVAMRKMRARMANPRCEPRSGGNRLPFMRGAAAMSTFYILGEVAARSPDRTAESATEARCRCTRTSSVGRQGGDR